MSGETIRVVESRSRIAVWIPACRPTGDGRCSAPWHRHDNPKDIGKVPLVKGFSSFASNPPSEEALRENFRRFSHIATNTGMVVPEGWCGVDADSPEAEAEVVAYIGNHHVTVTRKRRPGRGPCWLFRLPDGVTFTTMTKKGASGAIDLLFAGRFLVLPPSLHSSGHVHEWERAPWEAPVAMMPPALLAAIERWSADSTPKGTVNQVSIVQVSDEELAYGRRLINARSRLRRTWEGEKGDGDTSNSGQDFSFARAALVAGLKPQVVTALLMQRPGVHRATADYVEKTVTNAVASLKGGAR